MTPTGWSGGQHSGLQGTKVGSKTHPNGYVLRSGKEPVNEDAHEGRVETELNIEKGQLGVGHALRYDDSPDGDACTNIISLEQ